MIVLSEDSPDRPQSPSAKENRTATEVARLLGFRVYYIPGDFEECGTAENALAYVPPQECETPGVWIGFIPTPDQYEQIYEEALRKNIRLLNSTAEHLEAQEFDRAYPHLTGLTPESVIITSPDECRSALDVVGLPAFIKGAVQSRKSRGWKACVAETLEEAERLTASYLSLEGRSRGRVVIRRLVKLRHEQSSPQGFPFGREYRVFLYRDRVLAYGYYWEGDDPLKEVTRSEEGQILTLAVEAARRIGTPLVAIDIGQLESGEWIVIESGDAQFAGVSQIPPLRLWTAIRDVCTTLERARGSLMRFRAERAIIE
jgi:hypothetical protein